MTHVSPGYIYKQRCERLIAVLADTMLPGDPGDVKFHFVINGSVSEARQLLVDKGTLNSELMGFKSIGRRVLRILDAEESRKLDSFYKKIAPKRRRAISKRKKRESH
jgi:hypothetical protein